MAELSPMMQQYLEIKKQHKDEILFLISASRYSFTLASFPLIARRTYHFFSISDIFPRF